MASHWTDPGAFPVADGIHRIPLPLPTDGLRAVNVYAVEADDGLTLVDGGWALDVSRARLEESLAAIGHRVADIRRFLVTHAHRDHYTQAVALRREVGAHVSLGLEEKGTLDLLHQGEGRDPILARIRSTGAEAVAAGWVEAMAGHRVDLSHWDYPDAWLDGDHPVEVGARTLEALHTPGHTRGHYVFADREAGLLFAGDHVLPAITPSIGFETNAAAQPLGDFLASLAKVRALPDLLLLPAHGPVAGSTHQRVDELVAHHDVRLDLCRAAVGTRTRTAYDVAGDLPWTRHARSLAELDVFNSALASLETMAHLDLLWARGELDRTVTDGVPSYSAAGRTIGV